MQQVVHRLIVSLLAWELLSIVLAAGACSTGSAENNSAGGLLPGRTAGGKPVGMFFFVSSSDFNNQRVYYFAPGGQVYLARLISRRRPWRRCRLPSAAPTR